MKYVVVDYYEGSADIVGKADTLTEAREIEKNWYEETDGECRTEIITEVNNTEEAKKYEYFMALKKPEKELELPEIRLFKTDSDFLMKKLQRYVAKGEYTIVGKITDCTLIPAQIREGFNKSLLTEIETLYRRVGLIRDILDGELDNYSDDMNELEELREQKRKAELNT